MPDVVRVIANVGGEHKHSLSVVVAVGVNPRIVALIVAGVSCRKHTEHPAEGSGGAGTGTATVGDTVELHTAPPVAVGAGKVVPARLSHGTPPANCRVHLYCVDVVLACESMLATMSI